MTCTVVVEMDARPSQLAIVTVLGCISSMEHISAACMLYLYAYYDVTAVVFVLCALSFLLGALICIKLADIHSNYKTL
jgi:hypothetical protein